MPNFKIPKQSKTFVFTNYELDFNYKKAIEDPEVQYIAYGNEICPTTGRPHHQGWIRFRKDSGYSTTKKMCIKLSKKYLSGCWMEGMGGSLAQNDTYCAKENSGLLIEFGARPKQGERGDLKDVVARVVAGESVDEILLDDPGFYHQFGRTLRDAEDIAMRKRWRKWMTLGVWLWGPTGVGKSHHMYAGYTNDTHYVKNLAESFWNGYTGQPVVLMNEFRGQIKLGELLDIVDRWPKMLPIKCREQQPLLAKTVFITSSKPPEDVYKEALSDKESFAQVQRRFVIVKITEDMSRLDVCKAIRSGVTNKAARVMDMFGYRHMRFTAWPVRTDAMKALFQWRTSIPSTKGTKRKACEIECCDQEDPGDCMPDSDGSYCQAEWAEEFDGPAY